MCDIEASARKSKGVTRRKKLDAISSHYEGGKFLKHKLIRKTQKSNKKSKGTKRGKRIENQVLQRGSPEEDTTKSLSEKNIRNRNEEIHRIVGLHWDLGQACGMTVRRVGDNLSGLF